jgi:hypothetical protein
VKPEPPKKDKVEEFLVGVVEFGVAIMRILMIVTLLAGLCTVSPIPIVISVIGLLFLSV